MKGESDYVFTLSEKERILVMAGLCELLRTHEHVMEHVETINTVVRTYGGSKRITQEDIAIPDIKRLLVRVGAITGELASEKVN